MGVTWQDFREVELHREDVDAAYPPEPAGPWPPLPCPVEGCTRQSGHEGDHIAENGYAWPQHPGCAAV